MYPQMCQGLILVDPLSANDTRFKNELSKEEYKKSGVDKSLNFIIMKKLIKLKFGFLIKWLMKNTPPFYYYQFNEQQKQNILEAYTKAEFVSTCLEEYQLAHEENIIQMLKEKGEFPQIPMVLITHSSEITIQENMQFGNNTREFAEKIEDLWQEIMKEYLSFSSKSMWLSAQKSSHYIHLMEPELIYNAVNMIMPARFS